MVAPKSGWSKRQVDIENEKSVVASRLASGGADADEVASAVRQMHSDIRLQYGEFADEVIAYSIGRTGALSSATAHQAGELVKLLASAD